VKYLRAYLYALYYIMSAMGILYLAIVYRYKYEPISVYFLYLAFTGALAGPLKIMLEHSSSTD
jgi:hypothetical protein